MAITKVIFQHAGKRCPRCQSPGPFLLEPSDTITVTEDGEISFPELWWDLAIDCECPVCGFASWIGAFHEWIDFTTGFERFGSLRPCTKGPRDWWKKAAG